MKKIILAMLISSGLFASTTHSAKIVETLSSGGYTYMNVDDTKKKYWIAMTQRAVKIGDNISFTEQGWMQNFHSKTLNRTFKSILFASDIENHNAKKSIATIPDVIDSDYPAKDAISIAELFSHRDKYVGKVVTIKGKVTKATDGIMKLNWLHLQDGSSFESMNDLVFTTKTRLPKVGQIVYAKGTVAKDKDFGYGYFYPIIMEDADFRN